MDIKSLSRIATNYAKLITLEEHQLSGGFSSAILEVLNDLYFNNEIQSIPKIKRIAIPDKFIHLGGTQDYLRDYVKLNLHNLTL